MKAVLMVFAAGAALFAGGQDEPLKKAKAKLRGTWTIERFETGKGVQDGFVDAKLVFKDDNLEMHKGGETKKASWKIDPSKKPAEIEVTPDDNGRTLKGIYQIEKDTLKICVCGNPDGERPTEFATKEGEPNVLITLKRAKD